VRKSLAPFEESGAEQANELASGELVPDPKVFAEFGITPMTGWRWDQDQALKELGWPAPIRIRKRKFRSRRQLDEFKAALMRRAIEERAKTCA